MTEHTKASLDGLFKDVYGESGLESLVPDFSILTKMITFSTAKRTGRDYVISVKLTNEHGFTYGAGLQTLQAIESAAVDDAKVRGSSMTLRTGFSYDAAANMVTSKGSFESATKFKFRTMMEAATTRLELQMLYGGSGLGITPATQSSSVVNTQDVVIAIDADKWAAGIWAASENGFVSLYETGTSTANTELGVGGVVNKFKIVSVDNSAKTITVETQQNSTALALVIDVDAEAWDIYWYGAEGNEMTGLRSIVANTGTLYGIAGATYSLWQGNTFAVGAANLTLKKIYQGANLAVSKGLMETVCVLVSPSTFSTLANDEAALRRYNTQVAKGDRGVDSIDFHGPSGKIKIVVHPMVWDTEAYLFPEASASRIGATDLSFKTPGRDDEMFKHLPNETGYECRLYSEQALFLPAPAKCVKFDGISNA
jgi:hypothetical protein